MPEGVILTPIVFFELRFHFSVFLARYFIAGRESSIIANSS